MDLAAEGDAFSNKESLQSNSILNRAFLQSSQSDMDITSERQHVQLKLFDDPISLTVNEAAACLGTDLLQNLKLNSSQSTHRDQVLTGSKDEE